MQGFCQIRSVAKRRKKVQVTVQVIKRRMHIFCTKNAETTDVIVWLVSILALDSVPGVQATYHERNRTWNGCSTRKVNEVLCVYDDIIIILYYNRINSPNLTAGP